MAEETTEKKKPLLNRSEFYIVAGFFCVVLIILLFIFYSTNPLPSKNIPIQFEISLGESLDAILDSLHEKKIIPSKFNMRVAVFLKGAERKIKAGIYFIDKPVGYLELVDILTNEKKSMQKKVTIPEGIEQPKLASLLKRELGIDSIQFMKYSQDKSLLHSLHVEANNLEGYLLPNTYYFLTSNGGKGIIAKLVLEMRHLFDAKAKSRMKELNMNEQQILTLASIIDGESNDFSEFKRIAGVYHNRLKKGMALQADPTIEYLIRYRNVRTITRNDLEINSRYNTYKFPGLPPGPINNPGKDAVLAALYPERNNYLYFVANGKGSHIFAETYEQHSVNVQRYRRWLRSQN
jgi:UPF0755 protein